MANSSYPWWRELIIAARHIDVDDPAFWQKIDLRWKWITRMWVAIGAMWVVILGLWVWKLVIHHARQVLCAVTKSTFWTSTTALQSCESRELSLGNHVGLAYHPGAEDAQGNQLPQTPRREAEANPGLCQRQEPHSAPEAIKLVLRDAPASPDFQGSDAPSLDRFPYYGLADLHSLGCFSRRQQLHRFLLSEEPRLAGLRNDHLEDLLLATDDAWADLLVHQAVVALAVLDRKAVEDFGVGVEAAVDSSPTPSLEASYGGLLHATNTTPIVRVCQVLKGN